MKQPTTQKNNPKRQRRLRAVTGSGASNRASNLQPLVKELRTLADGWRNSPSDPHNIANAVMVALLEVSNAIVRAYGEPPNAKGEP